MTTKRGFRLGSTNQHGTPNRLGTRERTGAELRDGESPLLLGAGCRAPVWFSSLSEEPHELCLTPRIF